MKMRIPETVRRHLEEVRLRIKSDAGEGGPFNWALGLLFAGTLMLAVYGAAETKIGEKLAELAGL